MVLIIIGRAAVIAPPVLILAARRLETRLTPVQGTLWPSVYQMETLMHVRLESVISFIYSHLSNGPTAAGIPHRSKIDGGMPKTDRPIPSQSIHSRYGQESRY
ncbi:hypothetical protein PRIO_3381 [Paenibacillus riograndensis SBR5]|uniref:Uncharacterized protein n=1 Tax=Paenibacillus riograndensis SBR5 TaxID=1073571 RepID=A0A0E4HE56_9BACL|nr:hypothetical protein PRIO_3381 [Paenibacillus riograndensis SBR5]